MGGRGAAGPRALLERNYHNQTQQAFGGGGGGGGIVGARDGVKEESFAMCTLLRLMVVKYAREKRTRNSRSS